MLKDLTINNAKYYESKSVTASNTQVNLTHDIKTVTETRNGKEKFTDNSNGNFEQKILRNRTLSIVVLTMNLGIDDMIAPIGGSSQTLFMPATKEFVTDTACGGVRVNWTPRPVSRTGVN